MHGIKIKQSDVPELRRKLLKEQKGICPLCKTEILDSEAALDHDHRTGRVRRVLHVACNTAEGKVRRWVARSRSTNEEKFLLSLLQYWKTDYSKNPIHFRHKTAKDKELLRLKRKLRLVKREATKQKYRHLISQLMKEISDG